MNELHLALKCGFLPEHILFGSPYASGELLWSLNIKNIGVVFYSQKQLHQFLNVKTTASGGIRLIRIAVDFEGQELTDAIHPFGETLTTWMSDVSALKTAIIEGIHIHSLAGVDCMPRLKTLVNFTNQVASTFSEQIILIKES